MLRSAGEGGAPAETVVVCAAAARAAMSISKRTASFFISLLTCLDKNSWPPLFGQRPRFRLTSQDRYHWIDHCSPSVQGLCDGCHDRYGQEARMGTLLHSRLRWC